MEWNFYGCGHLGQNEIHEGEVFTNWDDVHQFAQDLADSRGCDVRYWPNDDWRDKYRTQPENKRG